MEILTITLLHCFLTSLSLPLHAFITLLKATIPMKLPIRSCRYPSLGQKEDEGVAEREREREREVSLLLLWYTEGLGGVCRG